MGLFSWLFGRSKDSKSVLNLSGHGTFSGEIVGESHYQNNLEDICGGRTEDGVEKIAQATLVLEDNNPYDSKAVRIDIGGMTVGRLSKTHARRYRRNLRDTGYHGVTATCKAKVVGGWDRGGGDIGHFGVRLDLPDGYLEPYDSSFPKRITEEDDSDSSILTFNVAKPSKEELLECKVNDNVNLWKSPKDGKKICIFRPGTVGGSGRIGFVPEKYVDIIASHMNKGLEIASEITELTSNNCRIKCRLVSKAQTEEEKKVVGERLRSELSKKYTPRKGFAFGLQLAKTHNLHEGQSLYLVTKPIEYYVANPLPLRIEFVDQNNNVVARKENEPDLIRRILRAHFSGYELSFEILSISQPDKYTLPYVNVIEATAKVIFRKQS